MSMPCMCIDCVRFRAFDKNNRQIIFDSNSDLPKHCFFWKKRVKDDWRFPAVAEGGASVSEADLAVADLAVSMINY